MTENEAGLGALLGVLAIGVVFAAFGGWLAYDQYEVATSNADVEATVIDTSVEKSYDQEEAAYEFSPSVTYRFTYEGTEYTNDNVFVGYGDPRYGTERGARDVVDDYSRGETVTAYVPVDDPSRAYLINESSLLMDYVLPVGAMVLGVMAIVSGLKGVRQTLFGG